MVAAPVRDSLARVRAEAHRAWDSLGSIPDGHPLFVVMLEKAYRLGALASGESEAAATAYAGARMTNWHALVAAAARRTPEGEVSA